MSDRDTVDGYPLFSTTEDISLQRQNRAVTLANILEDHLNSEGVVSVEGMRVSISYWEQIPEFERPNIYPRLQLEVEARNLIPGGI